MYELSNWSYQQLTLPASDLGIGLRVLSAGDKPRMILGCSVHSGTNTAASMMNVIMLPSQSPTTGAAEYDTTISGGVKLITGTSPMNLATSLITSQSLIPSVDTRAGGTWAILPPQSILLIVPSVANLNGTVVVNLVSAELG